MIPPNKADFFFYKRRNVYTKNGEEWVLAVRLSHGIDDGELWTVNTWEKRPKKEDVSNIKSIVTRSFEVFFRNMKMPRYSMTDWLHDETEGAKP